MPNVEEVRQLRMRRKEEWKEQNQNEQEDDFHQYIVELYAEGQITSEAMTRFLCQELNVQEKE